MLYPKLSSSTYVPPHAAICKRAFKSLLAVLFAANVLSASVRAEAPYVQAVEPIKDERGRVQVIIDFTDDAHMRYPGKLPTLPPKGNIEPRNGGQFFHAEKTLALVSDYEKRFGFVRNGMTSWMVTA